MTIKLIQITPSVNMHGEEGEGLKVRLLFKIKFLLSSVVRLTSDNTANVLLTCNDFKSIYTRI